VIVGGLIGGLTLHPNGRHFALTSPILTGPIESPCQVWLRDIRQPDRGHQTRGVGDVAFSPDGKTLAAGDPDGGVLLLDSETLELRRRIPFQKEKGLLRLAYTPDGRLLAALLGETARLIDPKGSILATWRAHRGNSSTLEVRSDGSAMVTAGRDGIKLWEIPSGRLLHRFEAVAVSVAFSPDGATLATAEEDRTVRLRDASTGKVIRELYGHGERPQCVAFSPDGKRLVSGGMDRTVRLWDVESGQELLSLPGIENAVSCVAWSRDGRRIAAYDLALRVYEAPDPQE
jgi:WD40 repeat protein